MAKFQIKNDVFAFAFAFVFAFAFALVGTVSANDSFSIVDQPSATVIQGSTQIITWKTNLTLTEVSIDLYQNNRFIAKLGETTQKQYAYAWHVSNKAKKGSNYFIKISVTASNGKSAWANTQIFEISDNISWNKNYLWLLGKDMKVI